MNENCVYEHHKMHEISIFISGGNNLVDVKSFSSYECPYLRVFVSYSNYVGHSFIILLFILITDIGSKISFKLINCDEIILINSLYLFFLF